MTFSIVAWLPETGELGVGVATCKPAIGGRVPFVRADAGAVASQAVSNPWLGSTALELLGRGRPAEAALQEALAIDPTPNVRQVHLLDTTGRTAAWTGDYSRDWKGHLVGEGFCVAGNALAILALYRADRLVNPRPRSAYLKE